jgi:trimethylamine:corrinoid methyltransferase-like protein
MNRQTRPQWEEGGKKDMAARVAEQTIKILEQHRPAKLDDKIIMALNDIKIRGEKELAS